MSDYSASLDIPAHFKRQFSTSWDMVLQQQNQKFANAGMTAADWTAKDYIWQDLDVVLARETTGQRFGDTNPQEISGGARRGSMRNFDIPVTRDKWDNQWLERQAIPDGDVISTMKAAANRQLDDVFIAAAIADAVGGPDPYTTAIPLPATSQIAVGYVGPGESAGDKGLTPWKILEATTRFETAEIDPTQEEMYLAISPRQKIELASFIATSPNDYWAEIIGKWLAADSMGTPAKLMGYNVIMTNRLPFVTATTTRTCVAFTRRAFKVSPIIQSLTIDRLPMKRNAIQFLSQMAFGAMRALDPGVQLIACKQS
jgi:hypothetical protein